MADRPDIDLGLDHLTTSEMVYPQDLRPETISLARELERLPPGTYTIKIEKPDLKGIPWRAEIDRTEKIRIVDLMR